MTTTASQQPEPLVVRHYKWPHLWRALREHPQFRFASVLRLEEVMLATWAPVAMARWIATQEPQLMGKPVLRVLVVGAEMSDTIDDGMWYAALPVLLGQPEMALHVDLVGPELGEVPVEMRVAINYQPVQTRLAGRLPAPVQGHKCRLSTFLDTRPDNRYDLVFLFHPGLAFHREIGKPETWFCDDSLHRLVALGAPIVVTTLHPDDYVGDRLALEAHGYKGIGEPVANPFQLEADNKVSYMAHSFWRFPNIAPSATKILDEHAFKRMETLTELLTASLWRGHMNEIDKLGRQINVVSTDDGATHTVVALPYGHWLNLGDGKIVVESEDGKGLRACRDSHVDRADIESYPGTSASDYARAVWVADLAVKYGLKENESDRQQNTEDDGLVKTPPFNPKVMVDALTNMVQGSVRDGDMTTEGMQRAINDMMQALVVEPKRTVSAEASQLFAALRVGDTATVLAMLAKEPALLEVEDEEGRTPLYIAVAINNSSLVDLLLTHSANPLHRDREGWPPILEAARAKAWESLAVLLRSIRVDVNGANNAGFTALHLAMSRSDFKTVDLLLAAKADIDRSTMIGLTPRQLLHANPGAPDALLKKYPATIV